MTLLILEDDELVLAVKTKEGNERQFRGKVLAKRGGIIAQVTCADPAIDFDRMPCDWVFSGEVTLGTMLRTILANPTGTCPTGWFLHIEEFLDSTGVPYKLTDYSCEGKELGTVLADFARITGARWYFESRNDGWHFYWSNPGNWPLWKTLRDDIDYSAEDASNLRVENTSGEIPVEIDNSQRANRVRYRAQAEGVVLPPGITEGDKVFTDSLALWAKYGADVAQTLTDPHTGCGDHAIQFQYTFTAQAGALDPPVYVDLGYVKVPASLRNMAGTAFGWWKAYVKATVTNNQGISASRTPRGIVKVLCVLRSGANIGPGLTTGNLAKINPNRNATTKYGSLMSWKVYGAVESTENANGETMFNLEDVAYIQFRAVLANPKYITKLTAGHTWTLTVTMDRLWPVASRAKDTGGPNVSEFFVETQAVTDGLEIPIETRLDDDSLTYADATALATCLLDRVSAGPRRTVGRIAPRHVTARPPSLSIVGIHDVPLQSSIGLELPSVGVSGVQYPLAEICWRPLDSGDQTELVVGDMPLDMVRAAEAIKRQVDRTRAQTT